MSILATPHPATKPRTNESKQIAVLYAGILTVFVVAQLYTLDTFIELIPSFNLPIGELAVYALAPLLIVCELFAMPFLLRMALSTAFRWLSMVLGWLVAVLWMFMSLWVVVTGQDVSTIGFTGTVGELAPGWWAVCVSLALAILATWSSWGLWPGNRAKK